MTSKIEIYWTVSASKRLIEIKAYIEKETNSNHIAEKYIQKLIARVEQLELHPNSGQEEGLLKHLRQNSRYLLG
jgi:plasmid stabilization system protein ParE